MFSRCCSRFRPEIGENSATFPADPCYPRLAPWKQLPIIQLGPVGVVAAVSLIVVGASPQSTGGGIKTTALARLFRRLNVETPARKLMFLRRAFRTIP